MPRNEMYRSPFKQFNRFTPFKAYAGSTFKVQ